ncbi:hypothetical protein [Thioalkalivibrio sp. XN8]|uniref:hypothetical protein n=1 Tax=Thioalkalivibrio sp. XN8 TaxID=2712863 RepID=UPI0013EB0090|nr:hypothetical protein [Thioalkalivibrio sp. XN8]NGP54338.1 hypothetical protein [Thioalkalivibrio sp. XN8]
MPQRTRRAGDAKSSDPVSPESLAIARLAVRGSEVEDTRKTTPSRAAVARVRVELYRPDLDVDDDAMHYRLKMALLKGLRRRFRYSLIDVDDSETRLAGEQGFTVAIEPDDAAAVGAAEAVVSRVLRWGRWRKEQAGRGTA